MRRTLLASSILSLCWAGCATPEPFDYQAYLAFRPRSILVLPPLDNTLEAEPTYAYLSTVSLPLAERGYYVFPVAVVDRMMRENGLPTAAEMHAVSLQKLDEIFGADAVLYLSLHDWGTSYQVLNSATEVTVEARLVDIESGVEIWNGEQSAVLNSSGGSGGLVGMLASALVNQVFTSLSDPSRDVARSANGLLFVNSNRGLLLGPYHPDIGDEEIPGQGG